MHRLEHQARRASSVIALSTGTAVLCWPALSMAGDQPGDRLGESGCYHIRASATDRYLSNQTGNHSTATTKTYVTAFHTEDDLKPGEKFCLVRIPDDRHLIVGEDNTFLYSQGGNDGQVTRAWDPGPQTEWAFQEVSDTPGIYGIRTPNGRWLSADPSALYHGVVSTKDALGAHERWSVFAAEGCSCSTVLEPDIATDVEVAPTTGPIVGFADTHAHTFSSRGFGGYEMHGAVFDERYGIRGALPWCSFSHGREGAADLIGLINHGRAHKESGFPQFDGWPYWNDLNHQHQYHKWLERAYRGGLRLQVMLAVDNEVLCAGSKPTVQTAHTTMQGLAWGLVPPEAPRFEPCDDMDSIDRQVEAARSLEAFIDAQSGGEGKGWYRIAESAAEARRIMESGKMAVVLGAEMDTLFGCSAAEPCTPEEVDTQLDALHQKGIRYVFPLHVIDNGFGGAAQYQWMFVAANIAKNGQTYALETCPDPKVERQMAWSTIPAELAQLLQQLSGIVDEPLRGALREVTRLLPPEWLELPTGSGGHCNARGLTDLGSHLINRLMDRGMIIDIDHMSFKTTEGALAIAEARDYPLIGGHTPFRDQAKTPDEVFKSPRTIRRVRRLGGLLSPVLNSGASEDETKTYAGAGIPNDCYGSSKAWAQNYRYIVDQMGGADEAAVPFGSDMNGWLAQPSPRFGDDACSQRGTPDTAPRIAYPFDAHVGSGSFGQLPRGISADDTFDYNEYGLANVGLLPDFVEDLKVVGMSDRDLGPLFRSAEAFVQMWEKAESRATSPGYARMPLSSTRAAFSWSDAQQHCASQGLRLATRAESCLNGAAGEPMLGRVDGDVWMAVGDHDNAWISIGTAYSGERRCALHEEVYGSAPSWGLERGPEPITQTAAAIRCVGYERVPIGSGKETIYSFSWAEAEAHCAVRGMRLATQAEVCPSGPSGEPAYPRPQGDVWMAVGDHDNAWVSVGESYADARHCNLHEATYGSPPAWGVDKGPEPITDEPAAVVCVPQ